VKIAIVDYGLGNLHSVFNALQTVGGRVTFCSEPAEIGQYDALVLPGVGAFGDGMQNLRTSGLAGAIQEHVAQNKSLLGVCLGLQLLFGGSSEFGSHEGLGLIPGKVVKLFDTLSTASRLKIPQIGWHKAERPKRREDREFPPFASTIFDNYFYFVHSYVVKPEDLSCVLSETVYGDYRFCSAIRSGGMTAVQFHPEKSGSAGLAFYKSWLESLGKKSCK
jgi:imidazole glycerol-phosphate synthase subunit HisH